MRKVTVADMTAARDFRAALQKELLKQFHAPVIGLTMNIAGPLKRAAWIDWAYEQGKCRIESQLRQRRIPVLAKHEIRECTGNEVFYSVQEDAEQLKRIMCFLEDQQPWTRLLDIDVLDREGRKWDRTALGLPPRKCLICGQRAVLCARSRKHSADELWQAARQLVMNGQYEERCEQIARLAERALLEEVAVTPKPGLVDSLDSGAHDDMDRFTFIRSSTALRPYFAAFYRAGFQTDFDFLHVLAFQLTSLGCEAEAVMLRATQGVNTHKGMIFTFALLCGSLGRLHQFHGLDKKIKISDLRSVLSDLGKMKMQDFESIPGDPTAGERQFLQQRLTGIRGEAAAGYPSIFEIALPAFRAGFVRGYSYNHAALYALNKLICEVEDSNLIARSNIDRVRQLQDELRERLIRIHSSAELESLSRRLNEQFIQEHLSPGGCADLLAACLFIAGLQENKLIQ